MGFGIRCCLEKALRQNHLKITMDDFKVPCTLIFHDSNNLARLDEAQAGIKIAGRNINNLRYADDSTLMAESEELKSLLMKVKEESEKA